MIKKEVDENGQIYFGKKAMQFQQKITAEL